MKRQRKRKEGASDQEAGGIGDQSEAEEAEALVEIEAALFCTRREEEIPNLNEQR